MWMSMIVLHTLAGLVAFAVGWIIVSPRRAERRPRLAGVFVASIGALIVFMVGAMAAQWADITLGERLVDSGLVGLGLLMLWRARRAHRLLHAGCAEPPSTYVDDVGFDLISLFDAFVIVAAIDLGAPAWLVTIVAVAAVVVGHHLLRRAKPADGEPVPGLEWPVASPDR
jgi:hypothetical protein